MLVQWLATTGGPNGGPNEGTQPSRVTTLLAGTAHAAKELAAHARKAVTPSAPRRDHENYASNVAVEYGAKPQEYDAKEGHGAEPHGKEPPGEK
jgi:hypothetical protein